MHPLIRTLLALCLGVVVSVPATAYEMTPFPPPDPCDAFGLSASDRIIPGVRLEVETWDGGAGMSFNLSVPITDESIVMFRSPGWDREKQGPIVRDLFRIKGVTEVSLEPYKISVKRAKVFCWGKLMPQIVQVLNKHLATKTKK